MASRALFALLVVVLCFSEIIIFSNAVPITRTESLMHGNLAQGITTNYQLVSTEKNWDDQPADHVTARMDVELYDYPGSGANNRHTPKPQFGRCADC